MNKPDRLAMHTPSATDENFAKLVNLFPNAVTETIDEHGALVRTIDADVLAQEINAHVVSGKEERYQFTWADKRKAILLANQPIAATLRPCREDSVDFDHTENLYIEGDNLDVLKLLRETYLNRVKMIYIDPPYNTGNDFVYEDDFSEESDEFLRRDGQYDQQGNRLTPNFDSNGRFHTDWLNMIYPRLRVARDLLAEDGVIFISIDDNEAENLKKICNEVFGEYNFVATLVWDKNRKNDAKYFSVGHEYMLVYFKNTKAMVDLGIIFRVSKEGLSEVKGEFERLRRKHNDVWPLVAEELKKLYASWDKDDDRKPLGRYTKVDEKGPYRDDGNISWPGGGGPKYEVIHPVTKKPCKVPDAGWRFPNPKRMQEEIEIGRVVFGPDETTLPRIRRNLFESDKEVMRSVNFSYAQTATLEFNRIFDNARVFENPKHYQDIKRLIGYVSTEDDDIILDFFSGSSTTAHAVMLQNAEDGRNRRYIQVQLREQTDESSEAFKAGFKNICDIGKERIRRAARIIKEETDADIDYGFRVFRVDSSNTKDVYYKPEAIAQINLAGFIDNIKPDRTDEDLLFQVMLDLGIPLSANITQEDQVFYVNDTYLIACFGKTDTALLTDIAKRQPYYAVFRDAGFVNDSAMVNFEQVFATYSPSTIRRVL